MESESDPLTRRAVDLFEKEPLKGNSEVHLHTPTKFGEDRSKDLGGDREQTDRQTNRQTDKRCSIYSMIVCKTVLAFLIMSGYLLGKGGYVFDSVGLSVCLFVCEQHYSKSYERIGMKFYGRVPSSTSKN